MISSWVAPDLGSWGKHSDLYRYAICDVFTSVALAGNQLAIFLDGRQLAGEQMQALAREMNFAETVFLLPPDSAGDARVRIFTQRQELPFAGHPILGAAVAFGQATGLDTVNFETAAGLVPVSLQRAGGRITFGWMKQPIPDVSSYEPADELLSALGVSTSVFPVERYRNGPEHILVTLGSEDQVTALSPDLSKLLELDVAVSCFAGAGQQWKTRCFHPAGGLPEDPATGSAAGPIALHLVRHGLISYGERVELRQGAEIDRPSRLSAVVQGRGEEVASISVGGSAVIVAVGEYRISA